MLDQNHGEKFASGNKRFEAGGEVFANLNSNYMGLFGFATEIRCKDGQDTPEICCSFIPQKNLGGTYTRERYVSKQWRCLNKPDEPELEGVVMTPDMLEPIPESLPQSAGTVYALTYYEDSDDGCSCGTLAVSPDVSVLLRGMLDDLKKQGAEVILSHVIGTDKGFSFTYEAKETGVENLYLNYSIVIVDVLPQMEEGAAA